jgi:hypothetical protein
MKYVNRTGEPFPFLSVSFFEGPRRLLHSDAIPREPVIDPEET